MKFFPSKSPKNDGSEPPTDVQQDNSDGSLGKNIELSATTAAAVAPEPEYVTGWKLWSVLCSLVLIFILVLLDMSIVATVSLANYDSVQLLTRHPGGSKYHIAVPLVAGCWMVRKFISSREVGRRLFRCRDISLNSFLAAHYSP